MRIVASLEISMQIIEKLGKFYAMAWDIESMNLIFEQECASRQDAQYSLAEFVVTTLANG